MTNGWQWARSLLEIYRSVKLFLIFAMHIRNICYKILRNKNAY